MLTKGAIEDLIAEHLSRRGRGGDAPLFKKAGGSARKVFLSDWEMRRLYRPGARTVAVPANAIVSPLALDWLDYNCITVRRE